MSELQIWMLRLSELQIWMLRFIPMVIVCSILAYWSKCKMEWEVRIWIGMFIFIGTWIWLFRKITGYL